MCVCKAHRDDGNETQCKIKGTRGGWRPGAGRKPGSKNKLTREREALIKKAIELGLTPLEHMLMVLRDPKTKTERRDQMAIAAAPYVHRKLAPTLQLSDPDGEPIIVEIVKFTAPPAERLVNPPPLELVRSEDDSDSSSN